MSALALYEATRGVWAKVPKDENLQFAYATYGGLVMEVYEIQCWLKAGSQQYFTRELVIPRNQPFRICWTNRITRNQKIIRRQANQKSRSHGSPFVKVGLAQ